MVIAGEDVDVVSATGRSTNSTIVEARSLFTVCLALEKIIINHVEHVQMKNEKLITSITIKAVFLFCVLTAEFNLTSTPSFPTTKERTRPS